MNEANDVHELESDAYKVPTATIQTQHGPVEIPVDEIWHEYSESERGIIEDIVCERIDCDEVDTREYFIDEEFPAHFMTILPSFEEAKEASDGAVIMEGDYGGQIYLTCPMRDVECGEEALINLLREIDTLEWDCNEGDGRSIDYRRAKPGDCVIGGMGGGIVEDKIWIHEDICPKKAELIKKVISGELTSIN